VSECTIAASNAARQLLPVVARPTLTATLSNSMLMLRCWDVGEASECVHARCTVDGCAERSLLGSGLSSAQLGVTIRPDSMLEDAVAANDAVLLLGCHLNLPAARCKSVVRRDHHVGCSTFNNQIWQLRWIIDSWRETTQSIINHADCWYPLMAPSASDADAPHSRFSYMDDDVLSAYCKSVFFP
jgi:hypothetical protein